MSEFITIEPIHDLPDGLQIIKQLPFTGSTCYVYRVEDAEHAYCLKRLKPELTHQQAYRQAFRKEFELGRRLDSRYVNHYVNMCESEHDCYILTDYIEGDTLSHPVEASRMSRFVDADIDRFFIQLLAGVAHLHEHGILHLDLTPDNILVRHVNHQPVILDLGYCYHDSFKTNIGRTPGYSAPEVSSDTVASMDERVDVYSVGCILQFVMEQIPADAHINRKRYQRIIDRCCKPNPDDRYQTVYEVIEQFKTDPRNFLQRHAVAVRTLVAAIVLILGFLGVDYHFHFVDRVKLSVLGYNRQVDDMYFAVTDFDNQCCSLVKTDNTDGTIYVPENVWISGREFCVTSIGDSAFCCDTLVVSVALPQSIRHIGQGAFRYCKQLTTLSLPDSIEELPFEAFYGCHKLRSIHLPSQLKRIGRTAFCMCYSLKTLEFPEGLHTIGLDAFGFCDSLAEMRLPSSLKRIDRGIFWYCKNLHTVHLPAQLEGIGDYAFWHCDRLKDVYLGMPEPLKITNIFGTTHPTLHVPAGKASLYRKALYWKEHTIVEDPLADGNSSTENPLADGSTFTEHPLADGNAFNEHPLVDGKTIAGDAIVTENTTTWDVRADEEKTIADVLVD